MKSYGAYFGMSAGEGMKACSFCRTGTKQDRLSDYNFDGVPLAACRRCAPYVTRVVATFTDNELEIVLREGEGG